jgi:hypothetical protein
MDALSPSVDIQILRAVDHADTTTSGRWALNHVVTGQ